MYFQHLDFEQTKTFLVPEVSVYDAHRDQDVVIKDIHIDADYVNDVQRRPVYFDIEEAKSHLAQTGKSLASLPLLVNVYIALDHLAREHDSAAQILRQLHTDWDRAATKISPAGSVVHTDPILGDIAYKGLDVPLEDGAIATLIGRHQHFFQALLGLRDVKKLIDVAAPHNLRPFYWHPRGERWAMFGGGDFYYSHQHIPGLLMVFCDDEVHPRRLLRGVRQETASPWTGGG